MSFPVVDFFGLPSVQRALWVDEVADRFEACWTSGRAPSIAEFIANEAGERRLALLAELVSIDQYYRAKSGRPCAWDDYLREFPYLASTAESSYGGAHVLIDTLSDFLSGNAISTWPIAASDGQAKEEPLPVIEGYEILEELGRGRMGMARTGAECRPMFPQKGGFRPPTRLPPRPAGRRHWNQRRLAGCPARGPWRSRWFDSRGRPC
jgi:hypothetical protein